MGPVGKEVTGHMVSGKQRRSEVLAVGRVSPGKGIPEAGPGWGHGSMLPSRARLGSGGAVRDRPGEGCRSPPPRRQGLGGWGRTLTRCPAGLQAEQDGVPVFKFPRWRAKGRALPDVVAQYQALGAELNVLPFCSQFIPMEVISAPRHGSIIYHPSLLPRHRGASAINW